MTGTQRPWVRPWDPRSETGYGLARFRPGGGNGMRGYPTCLGTPVPRTRPRPGWLRDVEYDSWNDDDDRAVGRPSHAVGSRVETTPLPADREAAAAVSGPTNP